ncbi:unnamed protein product [Vitrella brassicaformis CCMP3155]|uniref:Uncharacterized protein n=1 Tax=Vitrella brassicaformis (strain CCMP3155) TaxID=1169540 RepID=A0A0G4FW31_VITBC|nr:unnamed protein product [Vitrella brassicaformis CCMP3155]|eukprot:CEM18820.1 unnamed protein product [Vitrella brassicaformis CCMP3155]
MDDLESLRRYSAALKGSKAASLPPSRLPPIECALRSDGGEGGICAHTAAAFGWRSAVSPPVYRYLLLSAQQALLVVVRRVLVGAMSSLSQAMAFMDHSFAVFCKATNLRFFTRGWGDVEGSNECRAMSNDLVRKGSVPEIEVEWLNTWTTDELTVCHEGRFRSPIAKYLPPESEYAYFLFVHSIGRQGGRHRTDANPVVAFRGGDMRGLAFHIPGTGDTTYYFRRKWLAEPLLQQHGIGSIILMAPFYGKRQPKGQLLFFMKHAADIRLWCDGVGSECCALMSFFRRELDELCCPHVGLGVTGLSLGGGMAAVVGAIICKFPIACVPCLGGESMRAWSSGALREGIDWATLAEEIGSDEQSAKDRLHAWLGEGNVSTCLQLCPPSLASQRCLHVAVVNAKNDHFVPLEFGNDMIASLSQAAGERGSITVRLIDGGHAIGYIRRSCCLEAIVDAFDRLAKTQTVSGDPVLAAIEAIAKDVTHPHHPHHHLHPHTHHHTLTPASSVASLLELECAYGEMDVHEDGARDQPPRRLASATTAADTDNGAQNHNHQRTSEEQQEYQQAGSGEASPARSTHSVQSDPGVVCEETNRGGHTIRGPEREGEGDLGLDKLIQEFVCELFDRAVLQ